MRYIFDLDHTVIDSSHRQATLPDGSLDPRALRENSTAGMIRRDKLLPLARVWREQFRKKCEIVVCTARLSVKPIWIIWPMLAFTLTRYCRVRKATPRRMMN